MKKTNCINCSSNDIVFEKGIWVCRACGSRFMPEADEIPQKTKVEELEYGVIMDWTNEDSSVKI